MCKEKFKVPQEQPLFRDVTITKTYAPKDESSFLDDVLEVIQEKEAIEEIVMELTEELTMQNLFKENKNYIIDNRLERKFYYRRDKDNHPRMTICLLRDPRTNIVCRGIALCSYKEDNIDKEVGRDLAESRAVTAFKTKGDSEVIICADAYGVFCDCLKPEDIPFNSSTKSCYNPILTEFEKKLFSPKE